ncbi:MAG: NAD-dependent epimerase/dehydratase family protein, partial [Melioribacteraceae bacterium]|nr:NAD-dependent epimerase/dehydratase family protein [Melioribacteraceae bacterium]
MKNILVTGGAGFIGSNLIKRLLDLDYNIVSIDNFDPFYDRIIKESNIRPFFSFNNFQHFE